MKTHTHLRSSKLAVICLYYISHPDDKPKDVQNKNVSNASLDIVAIIRVILTKAGCDMMPKNAFHNQFDERYTNMFVANKISKAYIDVERLYEKQ